MWAGTRSHRQPQFPIPNQSTFSRDSLTLPRSRDAARRTTLGAHLRRPAPEHSRAHISAARARRLALLSSVRRPGSTSAIAVESVADKVRSRPTWQLQRPKCLSRKVPATDWLQAVVALFRRRRQSASLLAELSLGRAEVPGANWQRVCHRQAKIKSLQQVV
jgi:hypothetical protein